MVKISNFEVVIKKTIYFSGEQLTGNVYIKSNERVSINSVFVNFLGTGRVRWTEKDHVADSTKLVSTISYENDEVYFNKQIIFIAKRENKELFLEAGDTVYPFEIDLPKNLPTSFHHRLGRVYYRLKATIDIPWGIDKHTEKAFSVIHHYDLNFNLTARQAVGATGKKTLCCGPCTSEPIIAKLSLQKSGYVAGESIKFKVTVENKTSKPLKLLVVKLIQQCQFYGKRDLSKIGTRHKNKQRIENREVASVVHTSKTESENSFTWNGTLKIPPVCATTTINTSLCHIIDIIYQLVLHFDVNTISVSTDMSVPIIIGTICLKERERVVNANESDDSDEIPMPVIPELTYKSTLNNDRFIGNPMEKDKGSSRNSDETDFKPVYPYYKFDEKI